MKAITDDILSKTQIIKFVFGNIEIIVGKRRKYRLPEFSSVPTIFKKKKILPRDQVNSVDCMAFDTLFNIMLLIFRRPVQLSMLSYVLKILLPEIRYIFFQSYRLLSHTTIGETMFSGEKGMNPVEMTIINTRKEIDRAEYRTSDLLF